MSQIIIWIAKFKKKTVLQQSPGCLTTTLKGKAKFRSHNSSDYQHDDIAVAETGPRVVPGFYTKMPDNTFVFCGH